MCVVGDAECAKEVAAITANALAVAGTTIGLATTGGGTAVLVGAFLSAASSGLNVANLMDVKMCETSSNNFSGRSTVRRPTPSSSRPIEPR